MDNYGIFFGVRKVEMLAKIVVLHLSHEQNGWLSDIGDDTKQLCGDYNNK